MKNLIGLILVIVVAVIVYVMFQRPEAKQTKMVETDENSDVSAQAIEFGGDTSERIEMVTDHVYVAIGYSLANMIMIEGVDGFVIVDTTESPETALEVYKKFRKISKKPLKGIIVTHFHPDHILGAAALQTAEEENNENIPVYTHVSTASEIQKTRTTSTIGYQRAARQFGMYLPRSTKAYYAGALPKLRLDVERGQVIPEATYTFNDEATFTIAGRKFTLIHTPGETDDHITVWLPDVKVVLTGDNVYKAFPNVYTIRGSRARDSTTWCKSLDKIRRLRAEFMVPSHTDPARGEEKIFDIITHYRDGIQFVHDQTIRYMNEGFDVDEIVEKVRLPPSLASHPYLQEYYGQVSWTIRGIYSLELGWFDGHPVNLNSLSKRTRARKLAELLGENFAKSLSAEEKILEVAGDSLASYLQHLNTTGYSQAEELQWSLELSFYVLQASTVDPSLRKEARRIAVAALKNSAMSVPNPIAKNYYLTYAKELETGRKLATSPGDCSFAIGGMKVKEIAEILPFRFRADFCDDKKLMTVVFQFSDIDQVHSYTMRHCILEHNTENDLIQKEFDAKLILDSTLWKKLLCKKSSASAEYASGAFKLEGKLHLLHQFLDMLTLVKDL